MLEIISVMAVIGVLTIGSIAFYRFVMNYQQSKALYNDFQVRASLNMERKGRIFSTDMENKSTYDKEMSVEQDSPQHGFFKITAKGVEQAICKRLIKEEWPPHSRIYLNDQPFGSAITECPEEDVAFSVVYRSTRTRQELPTLCTSDSTCEGCTSCQNGECLAGCPSGKVCYDNTCVVGSCTSQEDGTQLCCPEPKALCKNSVDPINPNCPCDEPKTCQYCNIGCGKCNERTGICETDASRCPPGSWCSPTGACISQNCTTNTDCGDCSTCKNGTCQQQCSPEECLLDAGKGGNVWEPALGVRRICCPTEKQLDGTCCSSVSVDQDGTISCCWPSTEGCCPLGQFWGHTQCYDCNYPDKVPDARGYGLLGQGRPCAICPNRLRAGVYCYLNTTPENPSQSCPDKDSTVIDKQCICPAERPMQNREGECFSCEDAVEAEKRLPMRGYLEVRKRLGGGSDTETRAICQSCNFRYTVDWCNSCASGQVAVFLDWTLPNGTTFTRDEETETLPDGQEIKQDLARGVCINCSNIKLDTLTSKYQCQSCPNTEWSGASDTNGTCQCAEGYEYVVTSDGTGSCKEKLANGCSYDKPIFYSGKCFTCDSIVTASLKTDLNNQCEEVCPNRDTMDIHCGGESPLYNKCVLKPEHWPKDYPLMHCTGKPISCPTATREQQIAPYNPLTRQKYTSASEACHALCENVFFQTYCYHCDWDKKVDTSESECNQCENRVWDKSDCVYYGSGKWNDCSVQDGTCSGSQIRCSCNLTTTSQ